MLQRAEVRCSIETRSPDNLPDWQRARCSARKCAALLRHENVNSRKSPEMLLQRAEVRCSIETDVHMPPLGGSCRCSARKCAALLRPLIEGLLPPPCGTGLQRAEVRCSIETAVIPKSQTGIRVGCSARKCAALLRRSSPSRTHPSSARCCSARKCAALLRRAKPESGWPRGPPVAARGSALLY